MSLHAGGEHLAMIDGGRDGMASEMRWPYRGWFRQIAKIGVGIGQSWFVGAADSLYSELNDLGCASGIGIAIELFVAATELGLEAGCEW